MTRCKAAHHVVAALLLVLFAAVAIFGGPMLLAPRDLPEELVALGDIRRVHLEVRPFSDRLRCPRCWRRGPPRRT